jgi:hypothetical protein
MHEQHIKFEISPRTIQYVDWSAYERACAHLTRQQQLETYSLKLAHYALGMHEEETFEYARLHLQTYSDFNAFIGTLKKIIIMSVSLMLCFMSF